jgi:heavy metal sensor kinase
MSLKQLIKIRHTLAFRLTLWYAVISAISFLGAFIFSYILITSVLNKRMDQELLNEAKEISSLLALKGVEEVRTAIILESESEGVTKIFFRLISRDGTQICSSDLSSWGFVSDVSALKKLNNGSDSVFETLSVPQTTYKARILYSVIDQGKILQIGQATDDNEQFLKTFRDIFGITIVPMIACAGFLGWFMARRALMGVEKVTQTAINISCGEFSSRVPITGKGEEIDRLAITFNNMLEHIQELIKGMKEMTDNIAHDLRSPLTRIRGIAETTLMTARDTADYELMTGSIIEECDRLLSIINTMLDISEAEAGVSKLDMTEINISKLVRDACDLFQPIAEDRDICLTPILKTEISVCADKQKLQRVIANLLDNALKYTPRGGTVTISVDQNEREVIVSFTDNGVGISEEDLPHIFERFYRCDRSRSQAGIGLGLSLAQALARSHGGNISVSSPQGKGSVFTLTIPFTH